MFLHLFMVPEIMNSTDQLGSTTGGGVQKLGQKVCERGMIHVLANASNSKS